MEISRKVLIGLPIIYEHEKTKAGSVQDIIIEPDNGKVLALMIGTALFTPPKILSVSDILAHDQTAVVITTSAELYDEGEIVRVDELLVKRVELGGSQVVTVSGQALGKVSDYYVDLNSKVLTKIIVKNRIKNLWGSELTIPHAAIVAIEPKKITVIDNTVKEIQKEAVAGLAAG